MKLSILSSCAAHMARQSSSHSGAEETKARGSTALVLSASHTGGPNMSSTHLTRGLSLQAVIHSESVVYRTRNPFVSHASLVLVSHHTQAVQGLVFKEWRGRVQARGTKKAARVSQVRLRCCAVGWGGQGEEAAPPSNSATYIVLWSYALGGMVFKVHAFFVSTTLPQGSQRWYIYEMF